MEETQQEVKKNRPLRLSYSSLDKLSQCPYAWDLIYNQKKRPDEKTLALDLGNLCHKALEVAASLFGVVPIEEPHFKWILRDGYHGKDKTGKGEEDIPSLSEIVSRYTLDWVTPDEKCEYTYDERIDNFYRYVPQFFQKQSELGFDSAQAEVNFEVPFEDIILFGTIDLILFNRAEKKIKIVDYKTSKKAYDHSKLVSPLQMYIYYLAVKDMFPDWEFDCCEYQFVLLGEEATVDAKGWQKRCDTKLRKLLADLKSYKENDEWRPTPSPLCHWCNYCAHNESSKRFADECPYYSLWTPKNKIYEVNKRWDPDEVKRTKGFFF